MVQYHPQQSKKKKRKGKKKGKTFLPGNKKDIQSLNKMSLCGPLKLILHFLISQVLA